MGYRKRISTKFRNFIASKVVAKVGPFFTEEQRRCGILASVLMAQFILESGYGYSKLARRAHNYFGMKERLSCNTWDGSTWDGVSVYTRNTKEKTADGKTVTISADFRKYPDMETSITDHSAYLIGAKNGNALRYDGIKGCKEYRKATEIIRNGGYSTNSDYNENLNEIIERWNLTRFDV